MDQRATKACARCKFVKPLSSFYAKPGGKTHSWCKPCFREGERERRAADPATYRDRYLRRTYGISLEEFEAMESEQGGVCAICGEPERNRKYLSVDHDHTTGCVRGLLCHLCNALLGQAGDDAWRLRSAADYLEVYD